MFVEPSKKIPLMKKFSFLLCLFVLLSAFTCEDEPLEGEFDAQNENNASLVGTWELILFDTEFLNESEFQGQSTTSEFSAEGMNMDYNLVFSETNYTVSGSYDLLTTIQMSGMESETVTYSYTDVQGNGTYTTNGNEMTINGSFVEVEIEGFDDIQLLDSEQEQSAEFILSADGQTLTFLQNFEESQNQQGLNFTISGSSSSVWQKIE